jgi:hypothetical protein
MCLPGAQVRLLGCADPVLTAQAARRAEGGKPMADAHETQIRHEGIARTLADGSLQVPRYQRSYAWEEEQVQELLTDLAHAIGGHQPEYFLGSIVVAQGKEVVDGQQRLATVSVLIAAIRDYFRAKGDDQRAEQIESRYLFQTDLSDMQPRPRLTLNSADHDFFLKRVLKPGQAEAMPAASAKPSHENLLKAAEASLEHVARLTNAAEVPKDVLVRWLEYLERRARALVFRVSDDANAFTLFETLDDRGLALATSDLLKNYLFGLAEDRVEEVQERWTEMGAALDAVGTEETLVTYIRHFWSSTHGATRERDLYGRIKQELRSKQDAVNLASELQAEAVTYAAILSPQPGSWKRWGGDSACRHMAVLNDLGMKQMRPLLLSILRGFEPKEVTRALSLLVSAAVRLLIAAGGRVGTGTTEFHYSEAAQGIAEGRIADAGRLARALRSVVPADEEFRARFGTTSVPKASLARYLLRQLELAAKNDAELSFVPNPNTRQVNLEHVLPQKRSQAWPGLTDDQVRTYTHLLGNLALTRRGVNMQVRAASFADKRKRYATEQFVLTKEIADCSAWTLAEIQKRQQRLAGLAVKAWPFPRS